jgi:outer membrane autotransporter protein
MRTGEVRCAIRSDYHRVQRCTGMRHSSRREFATRWFVLFAAAVFGLLFVPRAFSAVDTATITASPIEIREGDASAFSIALTTDTTTTGVPHNATVVLGVTGSATSGVDYEIVGYPQTPITLQFSNFFSATQTITVRAMNDAVLAEGRETVTFTILQCVWDDGIERTGSCPTGSSATVTIIDTTSRPVAIVEATDPNASKQGPDPGELRVRLDQNAPSPGVTVRYSVSGTAVPNQDYVALAGSVFIPQGQTSASIRVDPIASTSTGDRTVAVTLSPGATYDVGQPSSATVTITDATSAVFVLSAASGNGQVASTGVPLQPFVATVTSGGSPVAGVPILWTLVSGSGTLSSGRTLTDTQGQTSSTLTPSTNGEFVVRAQVEGTNQSVTFTALFNPLSGLPGLTDPQRSMASTLDVLCPRLSGIAGQRALTVGEQDLLTQCQALISSAVTNPSAATQGIAALTPEQASAPRKLTTQITGAQIDNITARLSALRRGARGLSLRNLTVTSDRQSVNGSTVAGALASLGETGGGASADDTDGFERLGVFVNGNIDWGSKDRSANEDGFSFSTRGVTAGVDYRFLDGLVLGLAFGYGNTNADIDANGGDIGANAWSGNVYGTYYATDHFYVEGSGTYGWGNYDQTRTISYSLLGGTRQAKADFGGNQYALMLGAGYDFVRGPGILDVYGRLRYLNVDLDSYREQGASGLDLTIDGQEATSLMSILGVNYTGSVSLSKVVLVPQGWLEWLHEYDDGDQAVTGTFVNDPSAIPFALATDSFDTDSFRVGLGLGAQFGQGRTAFLTYEARVGLNNYTEQTANFGVRLDF